MTAFQETLEQITEREKNFPPRFVKTIHDATRELEDSGIAERVAKVGTQIPDFTLENQRGEVRTLEAYLEMGALAVTFYRGAWCAYCNADLANLNRYVLEVEDAGGSLIAISPEKHEFSRKVTRTQKLDFEILHDPHNTLAAKLGLRFVCSPSLKALYRDDINVNLKLFHGDDDWTLPIPARFVIDPGGVIRYAESSPDYTKRPDPDEMLAALRNLPASG